MTQSFKVRQFLGVNFHVATAAQTLEWVREAAENDSFSYIVTPNVDHVVRLHGAAAEDVKAIAAYHSATLTVCDSRIIGRLAAWSGCKLPVVPGSDLTALILNSPDFAGLHCHVIGGTVTTIEALQAEFPAIRWTQFIPGRNILSDPAAQAPIVKSVIETKASVVFLSFGSLQSELVCGLIAATGQARGVGLCVGASLEFLTGEKRRAPVAMQRLHLEWLYRLLSEPRRLWRRYLVVGPRILSIWLRAQRSAPPEA